MSVLFFWTGDNYLADIKAGKAYHLNQNNELIRSLKSRDHIWAFTRRLDKIYVLAADLVVTQTQDNPHGYKYGQYRAFADTLSSRYFDVNVGPDVEPIIKSLSFYPKKTAAKALGQLFQGKNAVRPLSGIDEQKLVAFSSGLPALP